MPTVWVSVVHHKPGNGPGCIIGWRYHNFYNGYGLCVCAFVGERRENYHQRREVLETKSGRKIIAVALAEKRKLRGEMMIEMNEKKSTLVAEETKIEMMSERERDMSDENRTVMMKEGEEERGSTMKEERKKILVGGRTEGERDEKLIETEGVRGTRTGEIEGEIAQRKETERREVETKTEIETGIGIEGGETRGDNIQSAKLIYNAQYTIHNVLHILF